MSQSGIIFAILHDSNIPEITRCRTMASVPFACRYRLIDFALSNFVNSGITDVNIITNQNYQSLMDHIGSGKDWDLARRSGGIKILPPYMSAFENNGLIPRGSRLEALKSISSVIYDMKADNVVLIDSDSICNIDLNDMIAQHEREGADITIAVKRVNLTPDRSESTNVFTSDETGKVTDVLVRPKKYTGECDIGINIMVVTKRYLHSMLQEAISRGFTSLYLDILVKNTGKFMVYRYDNFYANMISLADYFATSMQLLGNSGERNSLFNVKNHHIYTKIRNSAPSNYCPGSTVSNSMIADGCIIEGEVENSIIFRGVHIGAGTVVKNSILFQDTYVGSNVSLNCVVADKDVVIRDGRVLSGHSTMPFYIEKGKMV